MRPSLCAVAVLAAALLVIAVPAAAATEANSTASQGNTTNTTVKLPTAPNITVIHGRAEAMVTAEYHGGKVVVHYTCYYIDTPASCPNATYTLLDMNGTKLAEASYAVNPNTDCRGEICSYTVTLTPKKTPRMLLLRYTLWSHNVRSTGYIRLTAPYQGNKLISTIVNAIPIIIMVGMLAQNNPYTAALGGIAGVAAAYILSSTGIAPFNMLVANIVIITAIILIYFSKR